MSGTLGGAPGAPGPGAALPRLQGYATLRHERFGAIVFNPYLGIEAELDPLEAFAAAMCTGEHEWRQIEAAVATRFGLPQDAARLRVADAAGRLEGLLVLGAARGVARAHARLPDIPAFAVDGPALSAPKSVIWDVTYACNLACPHCLTASGRKRHNELDTSEALAVIAEFERAGILYLSLSGGEPLLRRDLVELLRRLARGGMRVDIATNGTHLPQAVLRALRELPIFQIQVSLDGLGDAHDRFRGRRGAFQASCAALRRLRDEGIATSVSTTVTAENLGQIEGLVDLALELGCSGYKAIPFIPCGRGQSADARLRLSPAALASLCATLARRCEELAGRMTIATEGGFDFLLNQRRSEGAGCTGCAVPAADDRDARLMGCSAGQDTLSVGADGTAYPCPFLQDHPLGKLLETPLRELWARAPTLQALRRLTQADFGEPCRHCDHAGRECGGGCRAAAWLAHGDLLAHDPSCFRQHLLAASGPAA